jgi:PIN domain nuclease of toxin-antitoxin system
MKILLDTHVLLWLRTEDRKLSREHRRALEKAVRSGERIGVAAITLWEIAKLEANGRVRVPGGLRSFLEETAARDELFILPLTAEVALESTRLGPDFPRDPADQLIAATARVHGLQLLTVDERIRGSGAVAVV